MNRRVLLGSAALLAVALVGGVLFYATGNGTAKSGSGGVKAEHLVRFYSPTIGPQDAKVHIVEFLDPACETCGAFYPHVKQMMAANPDKIRLTIRHVPFHAGSDYVVQVLEAAKRQGKYWQALEAVLASQDSWTANHRAQPERVWAVIGGIGLNLEQVKADMTAPDIAQRIAQDLADAKALKVTKTPEYFVNGRPLPTFGLEQLQDLVRQEMATAYRAQ